MLQPQREIYEIADIYALPNGQRAELIDGRMYMMAPPSTIHQRISSEPAWNNLQLHQNQRRNLQCVCRTICSVY